MSDAVQPNCGCPTPVLISVPGSSGLSSFTYTTATFVVPVLNSSVQISVQTTAIFVITESVIIGNDTNIGGTYFILSIDSGTLMTIVATNGLAAGVTIPIGYKVVGTGSPGENAYTTLGSDFVLNPSPTTSTMEVISTRWMAPGQVLIVNDNQFGTGYAHVRVISINSGTFATVLFLNYSGDTTAPFLPAGSNVVVSGADSTIGALPSPLPDSSRGSTVSSVTAGTGAFFITVPLSSLATGLSTSAVSILNGYTPGFNFFVNSIVFVSTIVGAGAGASQTFSVAITGVPVTGGLLVVTLASTNAIGKQSFSSSITGLQNGGPSDTISLNMASGGTAFTSGAGFFIIYLINIDTANSISSINSKLTALIAAL